MCEDNIGIHTHACILYMHLHMLHEFSIDFLAWAVECVLESAVEISSADLQSRNHRVLARLALKERRLANMSEAAEQWRVTKSFHGQKKPLIQVACDNVYSCF